MRWDNLTTAEDEGTRLPGYRGPAVIRRFDAPEALDMRFYEIHAKSALNRVPKASKMPFRWTINPYRGCSHACVYCLGGDTRILVADGRHRPLASLRVGDEIYGTRSDGRHHRYVRTRVLAHWASVKPAYRVVLEDGTELIASGDHRFLTRRGWKHVNGSEHGADRRPHLMIGGRLLGTGGFAEGPQHADDYERRYLCGLVRGDGNLASSYAYERAGRTSHGIVHRFRPALTDDEARRRAERYLLARGVQTTRLASHAGAGRRRPVQAVGTQARSRCERIRELVAWPVSPSDEWRKGFLAGSFDAEGSGNGEHVAMVGTNTDPYQWVESRYRLMPGIWEAMRDARNPCSILTKSPLLLRDIDLMREIAAVTDIHANLSIPTLDAKAWRATEPHTPHPRARLEAVAEINRAGIPTGVLIAPLMPGVNDAPEQVEPLLEAAAAAGAVGIGGIALHLRGEVRQIYFDWLQTYRPDLLALYEELYARGAYAPAEERRRLAELVRREETSSWPGRFGGRDDGRRTEAGGAGSAAGPPEEVQETLF